MSGEIVYVSTARIERVKGPLRRTYIPIETEPVLSGMHSEIAAHYGIDMELHEPHTTTLDYMVAATCLIDY